MFSIKFPGYLEGKRCLEGLGLGLSVSEGGSIWGEGALSLGWIETGGPNDGLYKHSLKDSRSVADQQLKMQKALEPYSPASAAHTA
jgi:hypothetical protein